MKRLITTILSTLIVGNILAQASEVPTDTIAKYFREIETAGSANASLWGRNLYGPMLFVNSETHRVYGNMPDTLSILKKDGVVFTGTLPKEMNVANTAIDWAGRRWAMIMLPLPANKADRINLLSHESFHAWQPTLGFELSNPQNNHLDEMNGRVYLRLELEALKKAIESSGDVQRNHILSALIFRKYRQQIYPGSASTENLLELNEGLAEYTGAAMSGRNPNEAVAHYVKGVDKFLTNPTFVRSFAYQTIPLYGAVLATTHPQWNRDINKSTNLTEYFIKAFSLSMPADLKTSVQRIQGGYGDKLILKEEKAREEKRVELVRFYKKKLVEDPHFVIGFENLGVSFDPRTIIPLESYGTVYPAIRITDNWGILTIEKGGLMSPGWDKISIEPPLHTDDNVITGNGWTLSLKPGYSVIKDSTGNYSLEKK